MATAGKNLGEDLTTGGKAPEYEGGTLTEGEFLDNAEQYLGPNYTEKSSGRFVSGDGTKQVRFGEHETSTDPNHAHFESYDSNGRIDENTKVDIQN